MFKSAGKYRLQMMADLFMDQCSNVSDAIS